MKRDCNRRSRPRVVSVDRKKKNIFFKKKKKKRTGERICLYTLLERGEGKVSGSTPACRYYTTTTTHTLSLFPPFLSSPVPFFFPAELFERVVRTPRDVIEKGKPSSLAA